MVDKTVDEFQRFAMDTTTSHATIHVRLSWMARAVMLLLRVYRVNPIEFAFKFSGV